MLIILTTSGELCSVVSGAAGRVAGTRMLVLRHLSVGGLSSLLLTDTPLPCWERSCKDLEESPKILDQEVGMTATLANQALSLQPADAGPLGVLIKVVRVALILEHATIDRTTSPGSHGPQWSV